VVGATVAVDGLAHTVVGVMPAALRHPAKRSSGCRSRSTPARRDSRGNHFLRVLGRLRPGVGLSSAQQQMSTIAARITAAHPDQQSGRGVRLVPLREQLVQGARPALRVFMGAVGLVLLICCFNVSNLLLARAAARQRETAVRVALGAGTLGLARQFVTEGLLLAGLGGLAGVLAAWGGLRVLLGGIGTVIPRAHEVHLDGRALLVTLAAVAGERSRVRPGAAAARVPRGRERGAEAGRARAPRAPPAAASWSPARWRSRRCCWSARACCCAASRACGASTPACAPAA
jgi:hypothetical protein